MTFAGWPPHLRPLATRGSGESVTSLHVRSDYLNHALQVSSHFVVPEANDTETCCLQNLRSDGVVNSRRFFGMLGAVRFHDQVGLKADEIHDVPADGPLPPEFLALKTVSQDQPQLCLFGCLGATKRPRFDRHGSKSTLWHTQSYDFSLLSTCGRGAGGEGASETI